MDTYDLVVIGGGPGGYVAAIRGSQLGMKVALVEMRERLGGTCLNVGCIPSKALLESSELFYMAKNKFEIHGISAASPAMDVARMMARKAKIVEDLTGGIRSLMKKGKIAVIRGRGVLSGNGKVKVQGEEGESEIESKNILLAMGSVSVELPFLPFDGSKVVSSTEALCFEKVPEAMVVVGGGAIGLELGSVWSRLGSDVTFVELLPRIAPFSDVQMSRTLTRSLKAQGMKILVDHKVTGADVGADSATVHVQDPKGNALDFPCDKVLVSVGRKPLTAGAGLEEAGVKLENGGRVAVDENYRTNVPGVYAIGDLIRGPMLAHKASEEGVAAVERMAGKPGSVNLDTIPNVIYTAPELAQVGLTEEELKEKEIPYKVGRSYFKANGRAKSLEEDEGLVKVLAHEETDRILGVHILGPRASDLIQEAVSVMEFGGSAEDIGRTVHAHPTLSETLKEAALAVDKAAIHG